MFDAFFMGLKPGLAPRLPKQLYNSRLVTLEIIWIELTLVIHVLLLLRLHALVVRSLPFIGIVVVCSRLVQRLLRRASRVAQRVKVNRALLDLTFDRACIATHDQRLRRLLWIDVLLITWSADHLSWRRLIVWASLALRRVVLHRLICLRKVTLLVAALSLL